MGYRVDNETDKSDSSEPPDLSLRALKRRHVRRVVDACGGDLEAAARLLDVSPAEVIRWLRGSDKALLQRDR